MAKLTNSFSHFFNIKEERVGPLFQGNFKAARITSDELLIHVARYIHLNPVTSYIIDFDALENYPYCSYGEYLGKKAGFCNTKPVWEFFKNHNKFGEFTKDQVGYQRQLDRIKHLTLE